MTITVSFTSIPERIENIRPMVESLKTQTKQPDRILLTIAKDTPKPSFLEEMGVEVITIDPPDWGPATKLIPFLLSCQDVDDTVITVDDDIVYDPYLIEDLTTASEQYSDYVIARMGVAEGFIHFECISKPVFVEVVGGYRGVLYKPRFFNVPKLIKDYKATMEGEKKCSDDHLFSYHLQHEGVEMIIAPIRTSETRHIVPWNEIVKTVQATFLNLDAGLQGHNKGLNAEGIKDYFNRRA